MNNKITYRKVGDYYLLNLYLEKDEYTIMLMDGTVRKHIVEADIQAKERFEILMKQMLEKNPIDENLKNTDPLKWVRLMNNYKHTAEEIIFKELIYI